ncbi:kinase-like domain-containing protein [Gigaspora rosea]|uniref:Kinase-like domain-containing protein n=1 Tax=Gigaspora rosea TaxID=44941 RepID=A0A397VXY9_9GLOM|nr:kinase-like domain-containing protein [Gigaspora rosea]
MNNRGKCQLCKKDNTSFNYCQPCQSEIFKEKFTSWSSGNNVIDEIIRSIQLNSKHTEEIIEWVPFSQFDNIQKFGKVYKATRLDGGSFSFWNSEKIAQRNNFDNEVILKSCDNLSNLVNELKEFEKSGSNNRWSSRCFGITQNSLDGKYILILPTLLRKCYMCEKNLFELGFEHYCPYCQSEVFKEKFNDWTSGNEKIDNIIRNSQLYAEDDGLAMEWVPFTKFTNIEKIKDGGFGSVYKAKRKDGGSFVCWNLETKVAKRSYRNINVALKSCRDFSNFLNELEAYAECDDHAVSIKCYGVTRGSVNDRSPDYFLILELAECELREYIKRNFNTITWKDRINIIWDMATSIKEIHDQNLIHRDLHPHNVLVGQDIVYIADLGQAAKITKEPNDNIVGVDRYIAPEIFSGQPYTFATDIYSLGLLMWEITSGRQPFENIKDYCTLVSIICKGERPDNVDGTPKCYEELMCRCWCNNPDE